MKKLIFSLLMGACITTATSQIQTPKASPLAKVEQKVGLADISISYSRPSVRGRVIFGDVLPFGEIWRLGANENTKITSSDALIFGKDTLAAGTYGLYAKPEKKQWEIYFYTETNNWGMPEVWSDAKVAYKTIIPLEEKKDIQENLSITIENITNDGANIQIEWANAKIVLPFKLATKEKVLAGIQKTMSGPQANDYHQAANYYFTENMDLKQALIWSTKAVELRGESAYWMTRLKAQLQAANGDFKGAIDTAKLSIQAATADGDMNYVKMNEASIELWSKNK